MDKQDNQTPSKPFLLVATKGYEVWAIYYPVDEFFELFASKECEDYIGYASTQQEAERFAEAWIDERQS